MGDHALRVHMVEPNPTLPEQLFPIGIMSKVWAERHGAVEVASYTDAEVAYVEDHANGTGPFVLEAYEPGARMVLVEMPIGGGWTRIRTTSTGSCSP